MRPSAPDAADVPALLAAEEVPLPAGHLAARLIRGRARFGITRVGSVTRLDRLRIPVVQAVRPLALSNAVAQGKGLDLATAAISAIMEAAETWAAESIPREHLFMAAARDLGDGLRTLYGRSLVDAVDAGWDQLPLHWTTGYDLLGGRTVPVPTALVDTVYTLPSPHPVGFPRSTAGLAAGTSAVQAFVHAGLEVLERDAVARARRHHRFFDEWRIDPATVDAPLSSEVLARVKAAGLSVGMWFVPSAHGLPTYWCHVIETDEGEGIAPLPAEGFGCDFGHDRALAKALLEACQARVTAIAGAREDIARAHYPSEYDRIALAEWRWRIADPSPARAFPSGGSDPPAGPAARDRIVAALIAENALAAVVVPLVAEADPPVHVLRLVTPPLRHNLH